MGKKNKTMRKLIKRITVFLTILLTISCKGQESIYSSDDILRIKIGYNELIKKNYSEKLVIISDSISSGHLAPFYSRLYEVNSDTVEDEQNFYSDLRDFNKRFEIRDSFPLKKALKNYNEEGNYVFFFSKIIENVLMINVYELNKVPPFTDRDKKFLKKHNYPYFDYFFKSPKKVYYFKFKNNEVFDFMEATFFW